MKNTAASVVKLINAQENKADRFVNLLCTATGMTYKGRVPDGYNVFRSKFDENELYYTLKTDSYAGFPSSTDNIVSYNGKDFRVEFKERKAKFRSRSTWHIEPYKAKYNDILVYKFDDDEKHLYVAKFSDIINQPRVISLSNRCSAASDEDKIEKEMFDCDKRIFKVINI